MKIWFQLYHKNGEIFHNVDVDSVVVNKSASIADLKDAVWEGCKQGLNGIVAPELKVYKRTSNINQGSFSDTAAVDLCKQELPSGKSVQGH